jgi:hypothetical protein
MFRCLKQMKGKRLRDITSVVLEIEIKLEMFFGFLKLRNQDMFFLPNALRLKLKDNTNLLF